MVPTRKVWRGVHRAICMLGVSWVMHGWRHYSRRWCRHLWGWLVFPRWWYDFGIHTSSLTSMFALYAAIAVMSATSWLYRIHECLGKVAQRIRSGVSTIFHRCHLGVPDVRLQKVDKLIYHTCTMMQLKVKPQQPKLYIPNMGREWVHKEFRWNERLDLNLTRTS